MAEVEEQVTAGPSTTTENEQDQPETVINSDPTNLVLTKKKKKKVKKEIKLDDIDKEAEEGDDGEEISLEITKKKKKKTKPSLGDLLDEDDEGGEDEGEEQDENNEGIEGKFPWSGSDRDYTYTELLDRVFNVLRELNPSLSDRKRTVLKPPQIAREGTKKTVFSNFMDMTKVLNRTPEHLMSYLLAELGTSGSLDGQQRLIVKGRFLPKGFEAVLRKYVNEYVLCQSCKSVNTSLERDSATRLMHLKCSQCGAQRTVAAIKQGFVARVTKRKG